MAWEDKIEVQKGDIGEQLVDKCLRKNGASIYYPLTEGAHPIDRLVVSDDGKTIYALDIKSKAKRKQYNDTGFNVKHFRIYEKMNRTMKVAIYFVDEEAKEIYGNLLDNLNQLHIEGDIVYFNMACMKKIGDLSDEDVKMLKLKTTKQEKYKQEV